MVPQLQELVDALQERSLTYRFFAVALSDNEIPAAFIEALRDQHFQYGTALDSFAASLAGADVEQVRKDLAADHSATLLGMSANPVSPYESVHVSEQHLMMQASRDQVVAAYALSGFARDHEHNMPEDHISLELDFVAALGERAATAIIESDEATDPEQQAIAVAAAERDMSNQLDFIEAHLANWVPAFADALEARAKTDFYRGVAQTLRGFIAEEAAYIKAVREA